VLEEVFREKQIKNQLLMTFFHFRGQSRHFTKMKTNSSTVFWPKSVCLLCRNFQKTESSKIATIKFTCKFRANCLLLSPHTHISSTDGDTHVRNKIHKGRQMSSLFFWLFLHSISVRSGRHFLFWPSLFVKQKLNGESA